MKKQKNDIPIVDEKSRSAATPAPKGKLRPRSIALLVALALIAAAYGAGSLRGTVALRNAEASWRKERDQMSARIEAQTSELAKLRSLQALWQLDSGVSQILGDLADKNYGLARDKTRELSFAFSRSLVDMDEATRSILQPRGQLLDEVSRAADAVSPDARVKAGAAKTLIEKTLAGGAPESAPPGSPDRPPQ